MPLIGILIHHIQKRYVQGCQDVTKILKDMVEIDLNYEDPTRNLSNKKYDKRNSIDQTLYDIKY